MDNQGLPVVGNCGAGTSRLMSAISSIAEHADMLSALENARVAQTAERMAGKCKPIRKSTSNPGRRISRDLKGRRRHGQKQEGASLKRSKSQ